jgi:hypothetical protein
LGPADLEIENGQGKATEVEGNDIVESDGALI